jgi:hypothetical protein
MTVRREIAESRSETGAWSSEGGRHTGHPLLFQVLRVISMLTD